MEFLFTSPEFQMCLLLFVALWGCLIAFRINRSAVIGLEFDIKEILSITGISITENIMPGKGAQFEIQVSPEELWRCISKAEGS